VQAKWLHEYVLIIQRAVDSRWRVIVLVLERRKAMFNGGSFSELRVGEMWSSGGLVRKLPSFAHCPRPCCHEPLMFSEDGQR
jgi:hypothetical protein